MCIKIDNLKSLGVSRSGNMWDIMCLGFLNLMLMEASSDVAMKHQKNLTKTLLYTKPEFAFCLLSFVCTIYKASLFKITVDLRLRRMK